MEHLPYMVKLDGNTVLLGLLSIGNILDSFPELESPYECLYYLNLTF